MVVRFVHRGIHSFIKVIVVKAKNYVGIGTNHTEWLRIWVNFLGYLISCCGLPSLLILHTCILHRIIFHSNRWSFLTFVYAVSQTFIKFMDNIFYWVVLMHLIDTFWSSVLNVTYLIKILNFLVVSVNVIVFVMYAISLILTCYLLTYC